MADYQAHFDVAKKLADEAGQIMRQAFSIGSDFTNKADKSHVTKADIDINQLVIDTVKEAFPEHAVIGEELSHGDPKTAEYVWVCDPIDGTHAFIMGSPCNVFSLALVHDGDPVIGVLYDPHLDRLFRAVKGEGAYVNDKKIQASNSTDLKGTRYFAKFADSPLADNRIIVASLHDKGAKLWNPWSVAYAGAFLAAGQIDGLIFSYTNTHDIAAVKIIVEEAGGKTTDLEGNDQRYDGPTKGFLASNGKIHDQLLEIIKSSSRP